MLKYQRFILARTFLAIAIVSPTAIIASAQSPVLTIPLVHEDYDGHEVRDSIATTVAISADGKKIAAGGDDHRLRVWNTESGNPIERLAEHHTDWIRCVEFTPSGDQLLSVGADQCLRLLSFEISSRGSTTKLIADTESPLFGAAFDKDNKQIATVGFGDKLRLFNLETGEETKTLEPPCSDTRAVKFSPDGRWIAAAGRDGVVRLWDQASKYTSEDLPSDGRRIRDLAFSPDGETLVAVGDGPAIRIWRYDSEKTTLRSNSIDGGFNPNAEEILTRPGKNHSVTFLSDENIAVGNTLGLIQVWNTSGLSEVKTLEGHTGTVAALACSEDGTTLISGSFDATVRVWKPELGDRVATKPENTTR